MNRWFGPWEVPRPPVAEDPALEVPVPVGAACLHCRDLIDEDDCGILLITGEPMHRECEVRSVVGSVGHQQGTCSCFGGADNGDPPGMTSREAAKAAFDLFMGSPR